MERRGKGLTQRMAFGARGATWVLVTKAKHQSLSSTPKIRCTSPVGARVFLFSFSLFHLRVCVWPSG